MNQRQDFFRTLKILHLSLLTGLSVLGIIALFVTGKGFITVADESFNRIFQVVAIVVSLTMLVIGFNLFKKKIMAIRSENGSAERRMDRYRAACLIWWAMIEGPGVLAIIGYLITANLSFFFLATLHILILLLFMPRKDNIIVLLNFNSEEII